MPICLWYLFLCSPLGICFALGYACHLLCLRPHFKFCHLSGLSLIPADCVSAAFVRSSVVTFQVTFCDVLSVWCPEQCSNNILIKAGKLTHLSSSLPVGVLLGTLCHLLPAFSPQDLLYWLGISVTFICAQILKSRKTQPKIWRPFFSCFIIS